LDLTGVDRRCLPVCCEPVS